MEFMTCPWCNGEVDVSVNANTMRGVVSCRKCNVTMKKDFKGHKCIGDIITILLAEAWNGRAEP